MWRGISLANKCLLLFGGAVVLIIIAALTVPWLRMNAIVDESQKELSRQLAQVWERQARDEAGVGPLLRPGVEEQLGDARVMLMTVEQAYAGARNDPFVDEALRFFRAHREENELHRVRWIGTGREYRYAKAARNETGSSITGLVVLTRLSAGAGAQLAVNTAYLLSAGFIALGLALLVFYLITSRLILSPVRALKTTAEAVREGQLTTRSDIRTGDEFEELSETFNQMLEGLTASQDQLRSINAQLDLKVNELSQRNVALFEANRLKGEFLANVSHELRTPLNSIIGFTELLLEAVQRDEEIGEVDPAKLQKRRRYLENILNSGKSLLELITGLLEMAKAEAGRTDLNVEPLDLREACEALVALIRPLADRGGVELVTELSPDLPDIQTDASKFQQIIFNLLSNAVKFTSEKATDERTSGQAPVARVVVRAERLVGRASEGQGADDRVRVSVLDTGPGISADDQKRIFQKFQQLDTGHTRRHAGTGLGLAICKELTAILQGEIQLESEPGRGSMFSVILPLRLDEHRAKEMKAEMSFRQRLGKPGSNGASASSRGSPSSLSGSSVSATASTSGSTPSATSSTPGTLPPM